MLFSFLIIICLKHVQFPEHCLICRASTERTACPHTLQSALLGEGTSKFSLSNLGTSHKNSHSPINTFTVPGGGINDMAASPCGTKLAVASRDGCIRLLDVANGSTVGGFHSYYGAMLTCCFSPDGKYVAAGGEDDLVAMYGLQERYPVVHGEGHRSWVTRLQFDPW